MSNNTTALQNMIEFMDGLLKIEDNLILEFKNAPQRQIEGIKDNWQQLNMIKEMAIKLLEKERSIIIDAWKDGYYANCENEKNCASDYFSTTFNKEG